MSRVDDLKQAHKRLDSKVQDGNVLIARFYVEISFATQFLAEIADYLMPKEDA